MKVALVQGGDGKMQRCDKVAIKRSTNALRITTCTPRVLLLFKHRSLVHRCFQSSPLEQSRPCFPWKSWRSQSPCITELLLPVTQKSDEKLSAYCWSSTNQSANHWIIAIGWAALRQVPVFLIKASAKSRSQFLGNHPWPSIWSSFQRCVQACQEKMNTARPRTKIPNQCQGVIIKTFTLRTIRTIDLRLPQALCQLLHSSLLCFLQGIQYIQLQCVTLPLPTTIFEITSPQTSNNLWHDHLTLSQTYSSRSATIQF